MMVNRKGEIGKFMTAFPVFLIIILLVAGFVVFSEVISKKYGGFKEAQSVSDGQFLLPNVDFKFDGKVSDMRVVDAVRRIVEGYSGSKSVNYEDFKESLKSLLKEEGQCLAFAVSINGPPSGTTKSVILAEYRYKDGKVVDYGGNIIVGFAEFKKGYAEYMYGSETIIPMRGDNYYIYNYLGRCLG